MSSFTQGDGTTATAAASRRASTPRSAVVSNFRGHSTMIARLLDVADKGWRYSLAVLAEPARMPFLAWNSAARKAHLGELLKLNEHRKWLQAANIRTVVDVGANAGQFSSAIRCFVSRGADLCV